MIKFLIEDVGHAEPMGDYDTFEEAIFEIQRLSLIDWDDVPNRCPCTSWETCGRDYQISEYDISTKPYGRLLKTTSVLSISSKGVFWEQGFGE